LSVKNYKLVHHCCNEAKAEAKTSIRGTFKSSTTANGIIRAVAIYRRLYSYNFMAFREQQLQMRVTTVTGQDTSDGIILIFFYTPFQFAQNLVPFKL